VGLGLGLSAGLLGHDTADVDQVVGNHPEADPALDSGIPLVPAATQSMPAGPPFLAVAEPTLLLFAFALRALGGAVGDADALGYSNPKLMGGVSSRHKS
jgi:hypothetical protein